MKKIVFCTIAIFFLINTNAQVVMNINGKDISKQEFEYFYHKNNSNTSSNYISLDEYVDLFINFKLKVADAYEQKMDTAKSFKDEFNSYRNQLIRPYLTDDSIKEVLVKEAYSRLKEDIEVNHILFRIENQNDTIAAYEKAMSAKKRINKKNFEKIALETSEDPSVKQNKGRLGYVTGMMLVYPFEKAAYDAKIGKVVGPIRTRFGYHLILVTNRRPSKGEIKVAHIFKRKPEKADSTSIDSIRTFVNSIYKLASAGSDFAELAKKYSEDEANASQGGVLPWLSIGRTNETFETAAFALKDSGAISKPVEASYGWHIIRLLEKRPIQSLDDSRQQIESRINGDERANIINTSFINKIKKTYNYKAGKGDTIATFANVVLTKDNLNKFSAARPRNSDSLTQFINTSLIDYENSNLEQRYPEFGMLMKEYYDGILLYYISKEKVWDKASKDTAGLRMQFEQNKEKYRWKKPHYKGIIVYCASKEIKDKAADIIKTVPKDSVSQYLKRQLNVNKTINVKIESGIYEQGRNQVIDALVFNEGSLPINEKFPEVLVDGYIQKEYPETYKDIKGPVSNDYQEILEKSWIDSLRKTYPVIIYDNILKTVK